MMLPIRACLWRGKRCLRSFRKPPPVALTPRPATARPNDEHFGLCRKGAQQAPYFKDHNAKHEDMLHGEQGVHLAEIGGLAWNGSDDDEEEYPYKKMKALATSPL